MRPPYAPILRDEAKTPLLSMQSNDERRGKDAEDSGSHDRGRGCRVSYGTCRTCQAVARQYLDLYPQVTSVAITAHETKWSRLSFGGKPHPHSFVLDSNGKPTVEVSATREGSTLSSGVDGFTFMKSTQSGWEDYLKDPYTTLKEADERICATSMVASWKWS